jgi:NAD(P) transhydrogenase
MSAPHNGPFDLAVIGSGPGGMRAAVQAAKIGKRVVVIDKNGAGGACVFYGTVPSKSLREAALDPWRAKERGTRDKNMFRASIQRMAQVVKEESRVIAHQLERDGSLSCAALPLLPGPMR